MGSQDHDRQDVEKIMRRAEELGHDPARVARALNYRAPQAAESAPDPEASRLEPAQSEATFENVSRPG